MSNVSSSHIETLGRITLKRNFHSHKQHWECKQESHWHWVGQENTFYYAGPSSTIPYTEAAGEQGRLLFLQATQAGSQGIYKSTKWTKTKRTSWRLWKLLPLNTTTWLGQYWCANKIKTKKLSRIQNLITYSSKCPENSWKSLVAKRSKNYLWKCQEDDRLWLRQEIIGEDIQQAMKGPEEKFRCLWLWKTEIFKSSSVYDEIRKLIKTYDQ